MTPPRTAPAGWGGGERGGGAGGDYAPRGLGTAYVDGFREAVRLGAELVIQMDCDLSHDPAALPLLVEAAEEADVVIGSRYVAGGRTTGWPWDRRPGGGGRGLR